MGVSRKNGPRSKGSSKKRKIKVSDRYVVDTFAGVRIETEIVKIECEERGIYLGKLIKKQDVENLRSASVPYEKNEDPEKCISVVYDFQIVKKIINRSKKSSTKKRRYARKRINN
tara:strand:+ start:303 stop:647 length:345 start_codon:yes stop_codon:yes gene_type:complete